MTLMKCYNNSQRAVDRGILFPSVFSDMFNNLFKEELSHADLSEADWVPDTNISETTESFKLDVATPGTSKKDVKVLIDNNVLTISGERKQETEEKNSRFTKQEFSYGAFKRSFSLPESIDVEKINANFENGILTLTLPKKELVKQKQAQEIKIS